MLQRARANVIPFLMFLVLVVPVALGRRWF